MKTATILTVMLICALAMSGCVLYPAAGPHGGGAAVIAPVPAVVVGPGPVHVGPHRGHVHGRGVRPGRSPAVVIIP